MANSSKNNEEEIFLAEELENRLADEATNYRHKCDELWQTFKFDPTASETYITGDLYTDFIQSIYDRIKPLNSHEANRFLTLSVAQFKTHTPEKRKEAFLKNYFYTYWHPNVVEYKKEEYMERDAMFFWKPYTTHFNLFKEATEKALLDFKAGYIGSQPQQMNTIEFTGKQINYKAFTIFIKQLEYNYPYHITAFDFKYQMKDNLVYLKQEVLDNLIDLNKDDRKPYVNRLKFEIQDLKQHSYITQEDIDIWLKKYNTTAEEKIGHEKGGNELYQILVSETPSMDDIYEENFNQDISDIQTEFYNFYYGFYIDKAIAFLDEQIIELNPPLQTIDAEHPKLKTNFSVPQLALLFKMLNELKPNIFNVNSEAELIRFISANFETKQSKESGISTDKLRILFNKPESNAADFWEKHFHTFITEIKKFK